MTNKIKIKKSPTADTRTCDWSKVTQEELLKASKMHIRDVQQGLLHLSAKLLRAGANHDFTKISLIDEFHNDFKTGFKTEDWYTKHKKMERHHINFPEGARDDIDLIDVIEHVVDCVMAGMARSGKFTPIGMEIDGELLKRAVKNTADKLASEVEVSD